LEEAKEKASKKGLVLEVTESPPGRCPKMSERDMYFFAFNLANFIESGFNMVEALTVVKERSANKKVSKVIDHLIFYINRGVSVSGAMQLTGSFSPLFVNLVRSGETSGTLPLALKDLSDFYKTMLGLRSKIMNAVLYPIIISIAAVVPSLFTCCLCCPPWAGFTTWSVLSCLLPHALSWALPIL